MGPGLVVAREVASQDVVQMALAQDENMVETVAPDRADQKNSAGFPGDQVT